MSLAPIVDKLQRLRLALLTDACLAVASGSTEDFLENALPGEQEFWAPLTIQLDGIENRLRKETPKNQIEGIRTGVAAYTEVLQGLVGRASPGLKPLRLFNSLECAKELSPGWQPGKGCAWGKFWPCVSRIWTAILFG